MAKFIILVAALAACHAVPVEIVELPDATFRVGRSPGVAWSFGSGFASDIGGIRHASGQSGSFQSGDAQAYGSSFANANNNYASGTAFAQAPQAVQYPTIQHNVVRQPAHQNNIVVQSVPLVQYSVVKQPTQQHTVVQHPVSHQHATIAHHQPAHAAVTVPKKPSNHITSNLGNFGSASSSAAANSYNGFGSAASNVYNNGFNQYQTAAASAQNYNGLGYESAVASANSNGFGRGSAVSSAQNIGNQGTAVSSAQTLDRFNNFEAAVAAAENYGNYQASTAQTIKQRGSQVQQSIASSVNAPGFQAANANAYNTGFY
ncbi:uncharacterized protein LOC106716906 [Papilio machaon]|uniref:uncharacterized protein LOC106716906 n=1 Tax=Papilio machaon TaxID=76193 RepID=UPI001E665172|nr:uncharacterized protein LOC106716906 [Papilio machaon]